MLIIIRKKSINYTCLSYFYTIERAIFTNPTGQKQWLVNTQQNITHLSEVELSKFTHFCRLNHPD